MFARLFSVCVAAALTCLVLPVGDRISPSMHAAGIPVGKVFTTSLSVAQEVPVPVGSPAGSGTATVRLSPAGDQITVQLSYTGLTSAAIMAHIHGDALSTPGTTGPVLFDLAPTGGTSGTNGATTFAITPAQVALLRSTRLYVNVHTVNNPSGEIRGQLHAHDPVGDTDGDGRTDFAVFRPGDPRWYIIDSATNSFRAPFWGLGTDVLVPGDYDGDGRIDLAVFRPPEGIWYIRNSSNDQLQAFYWSVPGDIPVPGDFDGDGRTDVAVFRPATGAWWIRHADGTFAAFHFGLPGDRPAVADFDGDGRSDVSVLRPTGAWWVRTAALTILVYSFGAIPPTPALVPADYTGDGRADPAVFDPATGIWRVFNAATGQPLINLWGVPGDVPVPGDYDSDGTTDLAVFRPTTGVWFIRHSLDNTLRVMPWGTNGDTALPSVYSMPDVSPFAIGDTLTVDEDAGATAIDVLANDIDSDGGPKLIFGTTSPANGIVVITGDGTGLSYQPNAGYCNTPPGTSLETFTYTLAPGGSTATVTVTVTCVNDVPIAVDDSGTVVEDSAAAAVNVLANDTNPDGHTLSISSVTQPANGAVVITGGGTGLTYSANPNYCNAPPSPSATPDTFTYTLSPGNDIGTVSMTVTCVNDAPVATDDALSAVLEDSGQRTIAFTALTANDTAGPSEATQTLTIISVSNPVGGTASLSGTDVLFTPTANFFGAASFDYTVRDNGTTNGVDDFRTDVGAVTFTVTPVNDAPVFTAGANQSVTENAGAQTVVGWATGISPGPNEAGQTVAFVITNNTLPGLFAAGPAVSPTGTLAYTPAVGANGVATITLKITDDGGTADGGVNESPTQQFTITVVPIPDPPVANPDSYQFVGNTTLEVDSVQDAMPSVFVNSATGVLANDSDPDSTIAVTGIASPLCASPAPFDCATANGGRVLMQTNGQFRYTPKEGDAAASDTFTYSVSDGSTTVTATVTLTRSNRVWYVKNDATAGGLGRSHDPFDTLVEAQTASLVNDYIFVYFGDGATTGQAAGFTMKNGQHLIGEFSGLSIPVGLNGNASPTVLVAQPAPTACGGNPCRPMLDDVAGNPQGVYAFDIVPAEIRGLNLAGTADHAVIWETQAAFAGTGSATIADNVVRDATTTGIRVVLVGTGATSLALQNNSVRATGALANAISISESGAGSLTITAFNDNTVSGDTTFGGIIVTGAIFDQTPGGGFQQVSGGNTIIGDAGNPVGADALQMNSVTGDLLFTSLDAYAGNANVQNIAMRVASTGLFNAGAGTGMQVVVTNPINARAIRGSLLQLQGVTVNLTFPSLTADGGTGPGVFLTSVAGSVTVTGATSLGLTTQTGTQGIAILGSSATVDFGTSTTIRSTTQGILVTTSTGNMSFGNATIAQATDAISLQNNSNGTRSFGSIIVTSTANSITGAGFLHAIGGGLVSAGNTTITDVGGAGIDIQNSTTAVTFGNTTVNATAGTGVNLANNTAAVTFADLDIAPDAGQVPFSATNNTGTITTTSGTFTGNGANAIVIDGPAGLTPLNLTLTSVSATSCTSAVSLIEALGTVTIGAGTIPSCTAASFVVTGGTVSATYGGSITQANAFPMVSVSGGHATGTITFQTGTLSATNGSGLQFDNADGVYNFNGPTTLNGGDAGIDILNGSSGTFSFGTGTSITNPSGVGFNLASSNANVTYSGSITDNSGLAVSIDNHDAGTITFQTGTITSTGTGLSVANSNGGAVNFNNSSIQLTTGANAAVSLSSNTSGAINFATGAGAGLDITTSSGIGFNATGGGTVSVTGSGNTIASTTGTALNVANTTIGVSGLTFQAVASNGAVSGIILSSTGAGAVTVAGTGSAASGGTIASSTGPGISLTNTGTLSLSFMNVQNGGDDGIRGSGVVGFNLTSVNITNNGNAVGERGIDMAELTGSGSMTSTTVSGSAEHNVRIANTTGTLTAFNVTGSTFSTPNFTTGDDGFLVEQNGTGTMNLSITGSTFTDNKGDHFQVASQASAAGAINFTFSNNTLTTTAIHDDGLGTDDVIGGGITISPSGSTDVTFTISSNNIQQAFDDAINLNLGTASTAAASLVGTISNNTIGTAGVADSGSESSNTITITSNGAGTTTVAVSGNVLRQYGNGHGILLDNKEGSSTLNATVTGNSIDNPGTFAINGIHVSAGATAGPPADTGLTCAAITGNTVTNAGLATADIRLRQRFNTTIRLPGYAGGSSDTTAVNSFVVGNNAGAEVTSIHNVGGGGFGYVGGAACQMP